MCFYENVFYLHQSYWKSVGKLYLEQIYTTIAFYWESTKSHIISLLVSSTSSLPEKYTTKLKWQDHEINSAGHWALNNPPMNLRVK